MSNYYSQANGKKTIQDTKPNLPQVIASMKKSIELSPIHFFTGDFRL